jgi:hypothetical protein
MPRVALPDSLQLRKISGCPYTPWVHDQHYSASFMVVHFNHYRRPHHAMCLSKSCWVFLDTGHS